MNTSFKNLMIQKITKLNEIIKNVIRANQLYKTMKILEATDLNLCVKFAENIYAKLNKISIKLKEEAVDEQHIQDAIENIMCEIATLIGLYGCDTLETLIYICIGNKFKMEYQYIERFNLLNNYIHPVAYKTLDWKGSLKPKDEDFCKTADNFDCFEVDGNTDIESFKNHIYVIKVIIHNMDKQNTLVVYSVVEDVLIDFVEDVSITEKLEELHQNPPKENNDIPFNSISYARFIKSLTLKELLVHPVTTLQDKYLEFAETFTNDITKKPLLEIISDFEEKTLAEKRNTLIMLLINSEENECHYLAYLLYDLLSNDLNGIVDTYDQTELYDSLPYNVKKYFHDAMKHTINYTNKLMKLDNNKLSFEQRVCLMKTEDNVKEKAMIKLKEIKMKSDDTCSKAMHYLDGLLKIPFGIYKEEPILKLVTNNSKLFSSLVERFNKLHNKNITLPFPIKPHYTNLEVRKYNHHFKNKYMPEVQVTLLKSLVLNQPKKKINVIYDEVNAILKQNNLPDSCSITKITGNKIGEMRNSINLVIDNLFETSKFALIDTIYNFLKTKLNVEFPSDMETELCCDLIGGMNTIDNNIKNVNMYMKNVSETLDCAVYGHDKAKRQIERIIGQWLNGDITGYCFGFEGPPGVGKTSLAKKGLSCCLKDENNVSRPFAFIAMGGSTNSSTLDGHNYTYVGSSWGRIVDILMDTKIMNPIIFIDELDKVSKTENGKEIFGLLTHLIDQTQNDTFQDKYFNGINLNLSKALFIFSYNDVDAIDRILLDRIHRIKFDSLTLEDKLVITNKFILPEIYKKMGLDNMIEISNDIIEKIIDDYTSEPGVRKLKEIIFEIIGEINLDIMKRPEYLPADIPIKITIEDIHNKYLKDHIKIRPMKIHIEPSVGVINGLWANSVGKGGILPIEASFFPSNTFLELKLTGMQGDVMKESMNVAKSLAWTLFAKNNNQLSITLKQTLEENKNQGIHIHVPEGATPKDGPSAGTSITMVLYSLFSNRKIKNNVAITGEICLQGRVTAIGGLELKILGGIRAGVKMFIYPKDNQRDFNKFMETYGNKSILKDIEFIAVETINEVIPLIFCM